MNRRTFIRRAGLAGLGVAAGATAYAGLDTHIIDKPLVPLTLGLGTPLRVVALGDIHFDPLYEEAYMERIAREMTGLRPDLIVYTGDFITRRVDRIHDLAILLAKAEARLGSYATLGNHDHWSGASAVTAALNRNGIEVLRNRCVALPGQDQCYLSALDSFWAGTPDASVLLRTPAESHHILLVHEPDPFAQLNDPRIRLQISGHTHGGQVRVPGVGALHLPKWGQNYQAGLYTRDGRFLYVNRGIGTLFPHARFNCPPEITVFDLI
jgi:predicted MPP superfamily phosphohydrolase